MSMSARRVRAIFRKELREYRRNRQIVVSMAILPLLFLIQPLIDILALPASAAGTVNHEDPQAGTQAPTLRPNHVKAGEAGPEALPTLSLPIRGPAATAITPAEATSPYARGR